MTLNKIMLQDTLFTLGFQKSKYQSGFILSNEHKTKSVRVLVDNGIRVNYSFKYKTPFGDNSSGYRKDFSTLDEALEDINKYLKTEELP